MDVRDDLYTFSKRHDKPLPAKGAAAVGRGAVQQLMVASLKLDDEPAEKVEETGPSLTVVAEMR